jgi:hypothetical protein
MDLLGNLDRAIRQAPPSLGARAVERHACARASLDRASRAHRLRVLRHLRPELLFIETRPSAAIISA